MDPLTPSADRPAAAPSEFPGVAPPPPSITGAGPLRPSHGRSGASARRGGLAAIWPGPTTTAAEQEALGRGARKDVPRRSHSELGTGADRNPHHIYVRQLRDMKGPVDVDALSANGLVSYPHSYGFALARAHARSGNATAISAYVGSGSAFVDAVTGFAAAYEAVNAADHAAFVAAVDAGRVGAAPLS